jgi:hypothetical protein
VSCSFENKRVNLTCLPNFSDNMHLYIHTYAFIYTYICIYIYIHMHLYIHTYAFIYTYLCVYIYIGNCLKFPSKAIENTFEVCNVWWPSPTMFVHLYLHRNDLYESIACGMSTKLSLQNVCFVAFKQITCPENLHIKRCLKARACQIIESRQKKKGHFVENFSELCPAFDKKVFWKIWENFV